MYIFTLVGCMDTVLFYLTAIIYLFIIESVHHTIPDYLLNYSAAKSFRAEYLQSHSKIRNTYFTLNFLLNLLKIQLSAMKGSICQH